MSLKNPKPFGADPNHHGHRAAQRANGLLIVWMAMAMLAFMLPSAVYAQASHRSSLFMTDIVMSLDKTNIVVGEPVQLKIEIINSSKAPMVEVRANFQLPQGNGVELHVQPEGELEYRYIGAVETGTYGNAVFQIVQGQPEIANVLLLFDREQPSGLLFSKPGTYTLWGKFRYHLGKNSQYQEATFPPTKITVSAPTGDNAVALGMLGKQALVQCLHLSVAPTTGILEILSEAAEKYPKTYLGALALRAEGMHYENQLDPAMREKSARLLMQYLKNGVAIVEGDGVAWHIAADWHLNKKYDLARQWVFWLVRNYPHSPRIQVNDSLLWYYYLKPRVFTTENPWFVLANPWVVPGEEPPADLAPRTGQ